jgi:uncharacterized protein
MSAQREPLSGERWHFQHGPIDIVIGAQGEAAAVEEAHDAAWHRFKTVLDELVAELPLLRQPVQGECQLQGAVARRMWNACEPYRTGFITPMAAVAGAVAQELIAFYEQPGIARAWINNGGDVALHLAAGAALRVGLFADLGRLQLASPSPLRIDGDFIVEAAMPVRGIATSGWRGRSFSLGIADSVTVLARTAAEADAAATIIANAVDIDDPRIVRCPACELKDDTDLGEMLVTVDVPPLGDAACQQAVRAGQRRARDLQAAGLIWSTVIVCQGWFATGDSQPRRLHSAPGGEMMAPLQLLAA